MRRSIGLLIGCLLLGWMVSSAAAQTGYTPISQSSELVPQEAEAIYRTNLARRENGLPPLRWNWQLTQSTRWFAWDKDTRPVEPNCTEVTAHQDSYGNFPDTRARAFSYPGTAGAENVWCTYVEPAPAVNGWMDSAGHNNNILNPNHREVGLGYSSAAGGWIAQDFGYDPAYAPAILNNEAPNTNSQAASLYIYNRPARDGFYGPQPAVEMQVSQDECFINSGWEPFAEEKPVTLSDGQGWKQVFVRTRDAYGRTLTVNDSIYLGPAPPAEELDETRFASSRAEVTLYQVNGSGRSHVQFSLGWLGDQFNNRSNVPLAQVDDPDALDGRAVVLSPGGEDFAWAWTTDFHAGLPMVAYFRLKTSDAATSQEVARLQVRAGANLYPVVSLRGSDFPGADQYIEAAIPFTYQPSAADPFLIFEVRRPSNASLTLDVVTIFSAPQPISGETMTWAVPGGSYRGQGVWLRYSQADGSGFTTLAQAVLAQPQLDADRSEMLFIAGIQPGSPPSSPQMVHVQPRCLPDPTWQVIENAGWLETDRSGSQLALSVNPAGLGLGEYQTLVTLQPGLGSIPPAQLTVRLLVVEQVSRAYLPAVNR